MKWDPTAHAPATDPAHRPRERSVRASTTWAVVLCQREASGSADGALALASARCVPFHTLYEMGPRALLLLAMYAH